MPSQQSEFWKTMVLEYDAVRKKIYDIDMRVSQGNLLSTTEGIEYDQLKHTRDRLIRSMGAEFPNLYQHHMNLRGRVE